jgi:hypothetical protein
MEANIIIIKIMLKTFNIFVIKMNLSVVILNFNRPDFVKNNIVPALKKNNYVDEIIISHGKEETAFTLEKTKNYKHWNKINENYGLSRRFLTARKAKNKHVIIMDDDIIPSNDTIEFLFERIKEDERVYGIYGRNITDGYNITNCFGKVHIVLTRCLITTKEMCDYFMKNFRKFEDENVKNSKPYWNGEDILFSLLSIEKYKKLPISYDLKHYNRTANYLNFSDSISLADDHLLYRKKISENFLKKLKLNKRLLFTAELNKKSQIIYFVRNSILINYLYAFLFLCLSFILIKKYKIQVNKNNG